MTIPAELEEKYNRIYALIASRMDAIAKAKCRDKPLTNRSGKVVKPATIQCGTVCRQKRNCKVTKGELRKVRSAFKGKSKREMAEAVKALIESKKAGQSSTRATYEVTEKPRKEKNIERREKRYQRSVEQAEKRAKAKIPPVIPKVPKATRIKKTATTGLGKPIHDRVSTPEEAIANGRAILGDLIDKMAAEYSVIGSDRAHPTAAKVLQSLLDNSSLSKEDAEQEAGKIAVNGALKDGMQQRIADFIRLTNGQCMGTLDKIEIDKYRALASRSRKSITFNGSNPENLFHEMGHHVEYAAHNVDLRVGEQFIKGRATGKPKRLSTLSPGHGYGPGEMAYPDRFVDPYVGKTSANGTSEVISMGLQFFSSPTLLSELAKKDPDHLALVVGMISQQVPAKSSAAGVKPPDAGQTQEVKKETENPVAPKVKKPTVTPTLKAQTFNPHAQPDLTPMQFKKIWDEKLALEKKKRKKASPMQGQIDKVQAAIDYPLVSDEESRGFKHRMTQDEANAYTAGSFTGDMKFYHGNQRRFVESMESKGLQPDLNFRGIYGKGCYFGSNKIIGQEYQRDGLLMGEGSGLVEAQAKVKNPFVVLAKDYPIRDEMAELPIPYVQPYLRAMGYDSIYIQDLGYFVTFDPKQTVITDVSYADNNSPEEKQLRKEYHESQQEYRKARSRSSDKDFTELSMHETSRKLGKVPVSKYQNDATTLRKPASL